MIPFSNEVVSLFAQTLTLANRQSEAEAVLSKILKRSPNSVVLYEVLGDMKTQQKDHRSAKEFYTGAVRLATDQPNLGIKLGKSYLALEEFRKAESEFVRKLSDKSLAFLKRNFFWLRVTLRKVLRIKLAL